MTEKNNKDTKLKILYAANELFAQKGFSASSMREIAQRADVNLSAINYHFRNKESLYQDVFEYNHSNIEAVIDKIGKKATSTEELATKVFSFFYKDGSAILNTFKIFLSGNCSSINLEASSEDKRFGPPGEETILQQIRNDLNGDLSDEDGLWATKMIFSLIVHFGVIMNTNIMRKHCRSGELFDPKKIELSIAHSVKAHLAYLKNNKNIFASKKKSEGKARITN